MLNDDNDSQVIALGDSALDGAIAKVLMNAEPIE